MASDTGAVMVERRDEIVTITLDRPEKRNALAVDLMLELTEALATVGASDALGVIIAATGPVFSAGHVAEVVAGASFDETLSLIHI